MKNCTSLYYFVRSGHINLAYTAGVLRAVSGDGRDWSSRGTNVVWGYTDLGGYDFSFNAAESRPSWGPDARYLGQPLRCLSTVLDI